MKLRILTTARLSVPLATAIAALLAVPFAQSTPLYWDIDGAAAGAGGATPSGTWSTGGTTWSTSPNGTVATPAVTTSLLDDLFFSAGVNATGSYTITLNDTQEAKSLIFQEGLATISGAGGVINLGGTGIIRVNNALQAAPLAANIGNNTTTIIAGTAGLTKTGNGTLTFNGSQAHTFTGGLNVNGGSLDLNFANLATPTNLVDSSNALNIGGGGRLLITGKNSGTTDQTLGNVTVTAGGGRILGDKNGGTATNINLGTLTATASGGSLLVGAGGTGANAPVITTTTDKDATGIYGGRVVFFNGTASTGYDWATTTTSIPGPYTLSGYSSYTALPTSGGSSSVNYNMTAGTTLTAGFSANTLKMAPGATSGVILDLGGNTLTLESGGLLFTGTGTLNRIQNGTLTAGADSGYNLVVHSFNSQFVNTGGGNGINNAGIRATIADNGANKVALVVQGTPGGTNGMLHLAGTNTFTGGIFLNNAVLNLAPISGVGGIAAALNNNTINVNGYSQIHIGNTTTASPIVLNNGATLDFRLNTNTFSTSGSVTGDGGITLGQAGGGATRLIFSSTGNNFTGPVRYAVTAQDGTLTVNSFADSSALGEGNITFGLGNGTVAHNFNYSTGAVAALTLNNRHFELTGTGTNQTASINNNSSQALTINTNLISSLTGTNTKNFTLGGTGAGLSTFAGAIPSGGTATINLVKNGSGTWVLSGDNSYNGTTTVSAGKLFINGNSSTATGIVNVTGSGTTLGGTGAIGGAVSIAANAILAPGASIESLATGALTMATGSTFAYEAANDSATGADLIAVGGTLSLTGVILSFDLATLAALESGVWAANDKLTLISYTGTGISSGFVGYADDTNYNFGSNVWTFNYNDTVPGGNYGADAIAGGQTNFVTLTAFTVIPEPSSALLGVLGAMLLLRRRRA